MSQSIYSSNVNMTQIELDIPLPDPVPVERKEVDNSETAKGMSEPLQIPKEVKETLFGDGD